ncbi:MAG: deoxyguanosinetriphosphate triphosphohydrolase [Prevotellaceae bacterium]|nr:deoxyguanosinetriphosphate triphosphohydrolase [Prevotellaceae bacterium]
MQWNKLLSSKRLGLEQFHNLQHDTRTEFQRDYDRLIFSPPFRRLQNKTQVFPLPGSVFVHNRLTHSLEVSCVGRSVGNLIAAKLQERYPKSGVMFDAIGAIVAAACLAHDLGNPPFGHSGERAIATFFSEGAGKEWRTELSAPQWNDFIHFEGNANTFRLLTHRFEGRREGGFVLTYSTLASIIKYPYESQYAGEKKKFGFFQSETDAFQRIASELGIIKNPYDEHRYARHPLVFPVEAADDICYQIMDLEDAFKLHIFQFDETRDVLMSFLPQKRQERAKTVLHSIRDLNEQIAYLRSTVIGCLIDACVETFIQKETDILSGHFTQPLIEQIDKPLRLAYDRCAVLAKEKIYNSHQALDIELAGFKIVSELLEVLINAVTHPQKSYSQHLLRRIPAQYNTAANTLYERIQAVVDYISGMTDLYALDLYRNINGISLPSINY